MGCIEKRGRGSWRVGVQVTDETGKRRWIRRTIKLNIGLSEYQQRRQAEMALHQLEVDVENGKARPDGGMTLRALAELWMRRHVHPNLSPVTAANYQHLLDRRILPKLGDVRVEKLTAGMLADFMAEIKAEGRITTRKPDDQLAHRRPPSDVAKQSHKDPTRPLSGKTLCSYYDCLYCILDKAVRWEILWRNPMLNVDRPKFRAPKAKYLDDDQAVELLRALQDEESLSYRCAVLLALTCGLRLGEVDGLTFADVDWKHGTIDISRALKYTGQTGTFIGTTKTPSSDRQIKLPTGMLELLAETYDQHQERAALIGDRWRGSGLIVCNWDGSRLHHDTPSKWFRKFALRHGFDVTFHQLRHTHATLLFASNIDAVAVATRLGHAKADITMRIYAHALRRRDDESAVAMQSLLDRVDPDPSEAADQVAAADLRAVITRAS